MLVLLSSVIQRRFRALFFRLFIVLSLFCVVSVSAQHLEWKKIDKDGNVLIDLSDDHGIVNITADETGWSKLEYKHPTKKYGSLYVVLNPDGQRLAGKYVSVDFRGGVVVVCDEKGVERYFDDQLNAVLEQDIQKEGPALEEQFKKVRPELTFMRYIGEGFILASGDSDACVYRLDGTPAKEFADYPDPILIGRDGFVNGYCSLRDSSKKLFGAINTKGDLVIPHKYEQLSNFNDEGVAEGRHRIRLKFNTRHELVAPPQPLSSGETFEVIVHDDKGRSVEVIRSERAFDYAGHHLALESSSGSKYDRYYYGKASTSYKVFVQEGSRFAVRCQKIKRRLRYQAVQIKPPKLIPESMKESPYTAGWIEADGMVFLLNKEGQSQLLNQDGENILVPFYTDNADFNVLAYLGQGMLYGRVGDALAMRSLDGQHGFKQPLKDGAVPMNYVGRFNTDGLCPVEHRDSKKWGAVDKSGATVIPQVYDALYVMHDERLLGIVDGKAYYVDIEGGKTRAESVVEEPGAYVEIKLLNPGARESQRRYAIWSNGRAISREYLGLKEDAGLYRGQIGSLQCWHAKSGKEVASLMTYSKKEGLPDAVKQYIAKAKKTESVVPRIVTSEQGARHKWACLEIGDVKTKKYHSITLSDVYGYAVVKTDRGVGMIDFEGNELIPPDGVYQDLKVGDPWVVAELDCFTRCHLRRKAYGYLDRTGLVKLDFKYETLSPFRNGTAWVAQVVRHPDLEMFNDPEEWFSDNRTVIREGSEEYGTISLETPGKYARVYSGAFKEGNIPHAKNGYMSDPERGFYYRCDFVDGKITGEGQLNFIDGRIYRGEFVDGLMDGKGRLSRRDGTLEFKGTFKADKRWAGSGYLASDRSQYEHWENGKKIAMVKTGYAYMPKPKPVPASKAGTRSRACLNCNGRGHFWTDTKYEYVPETTLILAGSRYYGGRYTHYEIEDEGEWEATEPSEYVQCGQCRGTGSIRY